MKGMRAATVVLCLLGLIGCLPSASWAHSLAPTLLVVEQTSQRTAQVEWKVPAQGNQSTNPLWPEFGDDACQKGNADADYQATDSAHFFRWQIKCKQNLANAQVHIQGLEAGNGNVVLVYRNLNGQSITAYLNRNQTTFQLPEQQHAMAVLLDSIAVGASHLLAGWDHFLFIVGLFFLLAKRFSKTLIGITGFTLGHGLALTLAVVANTALPSVIAEAFIMLSLVWLALELLGSIQPPKWLSIQASPWIATLLFGFVHGSGMLSSFTDLYTSVTPWWPLIGFNLGVELAQLAVIIACWCLFWTVASLTGTPERIHKWQPALAYGMGGLACFGLLELLPI